MPARSLLPDSTRSTLLTRLRLMESVLQNAHDAVLITEAGSVDAPGPEIHYVNAAFTRITGYLPEEVLGRNPRFLQGPLSGTEAPARIKAALQAGEALELEMLNYRKDGTTFWVELSISPVCDETGSITHWISIQRDITTRKAAEEALAAMHATQAHNQMLMAQIEQRKLVEAKLTHVAFHDALTGLHNRTFFNDGLEKTLARIHSLPDERSAVLFLDLDGFKVVNDSLGHRTGDLFLKEVATRLKTCVSPGDVLARMGGDEFTLLLQGLNGEEALKVAACVLEALAQPFSFSGIFLQITASIGLFEITNASVDAQEIMHCADLAMYQAKQRGGTQCVIFDDSMHDTVLTTLRTTSELQTAINRGEFELYYQPIVRLQDGSVRAVEALIRWNHPTRGLLGPYDFVPLAEEIGLIIPIGRWALQQALADLQRLRGAATPRGLPQHDLFISVNVSCRQLDAAAFLSDLFHLLREAEVDPSLLQLEITESVFMKDAPRIGETLRSIRAAGIKIAFDDFGTGYSSMSYLGRYPVDAFKVDQWFVRNLDSEPANAEVIRLMIQLAAIYQMEVSGEGVETPEQAAVLIDAGCTLAQGYLYGRPMPLRDMLALLDRKADLAAVAEFSTGR